MIVTRQIDNMIRQHNNTHLVGLVIFRETSRNRKKLNVFILKTSLQTFSFLFKKKKILNVILPKTVFHVLDAHSFVFGMRALGLVYHRHGNVS